MEQFWELLDKHPNSFGIIALVVVTVTFWRFFIGQYKAQRKEHAEQMGHERAQRKEDAHLHREQIREMTDQFMEVQRELSRQMINSFDRLNDKIDRQK